MIHARSLTGGASGTSRSRPTGTNLVLQLLTGGGAVQNAQGPEHGRVGGNDRGGRRRMDQRGAIAVRCSCAWCRVVRRRRSCWRRRRRRALAADPLLLPLAPPGRGSGDSASAAPVPSSSIASASPSGSSDHGSRGRMRGRGAVGLVGAAGASGGGRAGNHALGEVEFFPLALRDVLLPPHYAEGRLRRRRRCGAGLFLVCVEVSGGEWRGKKW